MWRERQEARDVSMKAQSMMELESALKRVAEDFRRGLRERLEVLERNEEALVFGELTEEGIREVQQHSHRIRGLAAMVGYPKLSALGEKVEQEFSDAMKSGSSRERLVEVLSALVDEIQDTLEASP
ncbi:MAG: hypothetical protein D6688_11125 [Alphaproteobacteria bacterium]|nr:MAG: hypothetical protein D6688_11125 [Alphaproteobacteria bacterium]